jgi:polyferredoxin
MLGSVANAFAASDFGSVTEKTKTTLKSWYYNLPFVAILFYVSWIMLGTLYYYFIDGWTLSTSFFFSLQLGLSVGFCAPVRIDEILFFKIIIQLFSISTLYYY